MIETSKRGGKRLGAGRPSEGKAPYKVTLTAVNVEQAKARTDNLSGLLDDLLARWLKKSAGRTVKPAPRLRLQRKK